MIPNPVNELLFVSYLRAGRIWPQIRGGINIALLHKFLQFPNANNRIRDLALSQLDASQVKKVKATMNHDHGRAGILFKREISSNDIQNEWFKSKRSAIVSLALHHIPSSQIIAEGALSSDQELEELALTIHSSQKDLISLHSLVVMAHQLVFDDHYHIAKLFALALHQEPQRSMQYKKDKTQYDAISHAYGIAQLDQKDSELIATSCCDTIRKILADTLKPVENHLEVISRGFIYQR